MTKLKWDQDTQRTYETGLKNGVLFTKKDDGTYNKGVAWNGLTSVSESPSGADETALYARSTCPSVPPRSSAPPSRRTPIRMSGPNATAPPPSLPAS